MSILAQPGLACVAVGARVERSVRRRQRPKAERSQLSCPDGSASGACTAPDMEMSFRGRRFVKLTFGCACIEWQRALLTEVAQPR
jgi:hypothetical protein